MPLLHKNIGKVVTGWNGRFPVPANLPIRQPGAPKIPGNQEIPLHLFPHWHAHHMAIVKNTITIQNQAQSLVNGGTSPLAVQQFIDSVCMWGQPSGRRVRGLILKYNGPNYGASCLPAFQLAIAQMQSSRPNPSVALDALLRIKGLGVSYASKHLRFMFPAQCPVLDKEIHQATGFPLSSHGYVGFINDCGAVAAMLPSLRGNPWNVTDVEMAVFACLYH